MKKALIFLTAIILLGFVTVNAQSRTGILTGKVIDDQSNPIPGVNIIITSPALIPGKMETLTNNRGIYRFINLPPGVYKTKAAIENFNTHTQSEIKVDLGLTTTVNIVLKIGKLYEEAIVVAKVPSIDIESNKISTNYTSEIMAKLPSSRNLNTVLNITAGISMNTGATDRFATNSERASMGSGSKENYYSMDGTYLTDPRESTQMIFTNYDIIEEVQVETAAHNAEYGNAPGSVVNVITKSGGNNFSGKINFYYRDKNLRSDNLEGTGLDAPSNAIKKEWEGSLNLGGPIIKNKLWFFVSGGYMPSTSETVCFPEDIDRKATYGFGKLSLNLKKHQLKLLYNYSADNINYFGANQFTAPEATYDSKTGSSTINLQWNYALSNNALLEVRGSFVRRHFDGYGNGPGPMYLDLITSMMTGNHVDYTGEIHERIRFQSSLSYWLENFLGGDHDIKLGFDLGQSESKESTTIAPDEHGIIAYYTMFGQTLMALDFDPDHIETRDVIRQFSLYAQDTWKLGRFNINFGGRLNSIKSHIPVKGNVGGDFTEDIDINAFTNIEPRIGLVYDLSTQNNQMAIKAHYGRYYHAVNVIYGQNPNNFSYTMYLVIGDMFIPIGIYSPSMSLIDSELKRPYSDSVVIGFETELGNSYSLKLNAIYKKTKNFIGDIDLNRTADWYEPVNVHNPITSSDLTVYNLKTGAPTEALLFQTNPEEADRTYKAITIRLDRRFVNNFQFSLSYTLSKAEGMVPMTANNYKGMAALGEWNNPNRYINRRGVLDMDRTHMIKLSMVYIAPFEISIGVNYVGQSGFPYARMFRTALNQGYITLNGEKPGSNRLPWQNLIDLRVEKAFSFGNKRPKIFFEVFNLLNSNTSTAIGSTYGTTSYEQILSIMGSRIIKVGIGFDF